MSGQPSNFLKWLESFILFLLLLPFYLFLLPKPGSLQIVGFVYVACICGYIIFLSPNRGKTKAQRRSLLEVPVIVAWILFWLWGVLPRGRTGMILGGGMLGLSLLYIMFLSAPLNRDKASDWGLGSPAQFVRILARNKKALLAVIGANLAMILISVLARELTDEIIRKVLRQSLSIRLNKDLSQMAASIISLIVLNLILFCIVRHDNIGRAAKIVGGYLFCLLLVIAIAGYYFIYHVHGGTVEFTPVNGLKSMGTYVIWGIVQELLFLSYFNTRIRKGLDSPFLSSLLTAVVFSLFHLTAYTLMFMCFLIMIVWAYIFQAAPNVFCLGFAHGVSGGFGSAFKVKGLNLPEVKATVGPFNL